MRFVVMCAMAALALLAVACASPTPTPSPTPSPTPTPTATPIPSPTPTPTPTPVPTPVFNQSSMAAVVLTQADVGAEFPGLEQDTEESGPIDAAAAAEGTVDPMDSAESLELSGYVEGYGSSFFHIEELFFVQSAVNSFSSARAARSFVSKTLQDLRLYQGQEIEGAILGPVEEFDASIMGDGAVGVRAIASLTIADILVTSVVWLRDNAVLTVDIISLEDADHSGAALRLAQRMDAKLVGVMSGEIEATPGPTPGSTGDLRGREAAIAEGYDLQPMTLSRQEISVAAVVASAGYDELTDSVAAFNQEIAARSFVFDNGASRLIALSFAISLERTAAQARSPITIAKGVDPTTFSQAMGQVFAQTSGIEPEELTSDWLDLPALGDDQVGLAMNVKTAAGNFDAHVVVFSRGRIIVQMVLVGPEGEVLSGDTIDVSSLILAKVIKNSPT